MRRGIHVTAALLLAGVGSVAGAGQATAEERVCRGSIGAVTVDNLRVPTGATCSLSGTYVKGTIKVESGATLRAAYVRVVGNVQAEGHRLVTFYGGQVGGSIQVKQGAHAYLDRNRVKGDVQSFTNRGTQRIGYNTIDGNLQCKENMPAPTGSNNVVGGNKEDQCRLL